MEQITQKDLTIGGLVARYPGAAGVFEGLGIDYCCGGSQGFREVCLGKGLDPATVLTLIQGLEGPGALSPDTPPPADLDTPALVRHIVDVHHGFLNRELPGLKARAIRVAAVHGAKAPELGDLSDEVVRLASELAGHLREEEEAVFPLFLGNGADEKDPEAFLKALVADHESLGQTLRVIRGLARNYESPDWACATYRSLMEGLRALEQDLHVHIHLENNVLFPRMKP